MKMITTFTIHTAKEIQNVCVGQFAFRIGHRIVDFDFDHGHVTRTEKNTFRYESTGGVSIKRSTDGNLDIDMTPEHLASVREIVELSVRFTSTNSDESDMTKWFKCNGSGAEDFAEILSIEFVDSDESPMSNHAVSQEVICAYNSSFALKVASVLSSIVRKEYNEYHDRICKMTSSEVFEIAPEIRFYIEVEYFANDCKWDNVTYEKLLALIPFSGNLLNALYTYYLDHEYVSVESPDDTADLIARFVEDSN